MPLTKLRVLDLSHNAIKNFIFPVSEMLVLEILDLSYNKIITISSYLFLGPSLREVILRNNSIMSPGQSYMMSPSIMFVDLRNNSFNCSCEWYNLMVSLPQNTTVKGICESPHESLQSLIADVCPAVKFKRPSRS